MNLRKFYIMAGLCSCALLAFAQQKNTAVSVTDKIGARNTLFPEEKLYLSFDRPSYAAGDTLWFKAILLAGRSAKDISSKLYVELYNDSSKLKDQRVILLNNGLGYGDLSLSNQLPDGNYTLRAYTNWQQNFGNDYFFQKQFYIGNAKTTWLVDAQQKINTVDKKRILDISLNLSNAKGEAAGLKDLDVVLMAGSRKISTESLQTTANGKVTTKITLPEDKNAGRLTLLLKDKKNKAQMAVLPLSTGNDDTDLQFMPEGGYLINGISSKVAFKAIGTNGIGKTVSGTIVNNKNEQAATFISGHNGMGSFFLFPQPGQQYTAVYEVNGKENRQPLNNIKEEGTTLKIEQFASPDSILLYLKASPQARKDNYQLVAQAAEKIVLAFKADLTNGFFNLKVPKSTFPDGIIHFTLFSPEAAPLNERPMLINHAKKLNLEIAPVKESYGTRDSVAVELTATDENGKPLQGAFAVAVTDNNQVNLVKEDDNIISHFLLTSGVKGYVENAGWYFQGDDKIRRQALDNLLLTQAWTGYRWETLQSAELPKFKAEKADEIEGQLTNPFKRSMPGINLTLLSVGKNLFAADTVSDNEGKFVFRDLPLFDSAAYAIKIKKPSGKTSGAIINIAEFSRPVAELMRFPQAAPWYAVTADGTSKRSVQADYLVKKAEQDKSKPSGALIQEVQINSTNTDITNKVAFDAYFFKGVGEEELKKVPRQSMLELLHEKIGLNIHKYGDVIVYLINSDPLLSIRIDKLAANFKFADQTLNYLNAEDVKDVKLYRGNNWLPGSAHVYYLEITTRGGKGPYMARAQGMYVYRPLPLYPSREFYSSKYNAGNKGSGTDSRATIFWNANVVTDEKGKAKLYFYAADKPATYTIKAEGTDMEDRFGFQLKEISVKETALFK